MSPLARFPGIRVSITPRSNLRRPHNAPVPPPVRPAQAREQRPGQGVSHECKEFGNHSLEGNHRTGKCWPRELPAALPTCVMCEARPLPKAGLRAAINTTQARRARPGDARTELGEHRTRLRLGGVRRRIRARGSGSLVRPRSIHVRGGLSDAPARPARSGRVNQPTPFAPAILGGPAPPFAIASPDGPHRSWLECLTGHQGKRTLGRSCSSLARCLPILLLVRRTLPPCGTVFRTGRGHDETATLHPLANQEPA